MTGHDWNGAGFCNRCHVFQTNTNLKNLACAAADPTAGHDFDAIGICRNCGGSAVFVGGFGCQSAPRAQEQPADKPQKQIHEMSLADYRRGVDKIWPKVKI